MTKCEVCGRVLKNPVYQQLGVGPSCLKKAGLTISRWREMRAHAGKPWYICPWHKKLYQGDECPECVGAKLVSSEPRTVGDDFQ